ncbi:MAG: thiamine pyrophosphate-binding protein [Dehalococcoidales bacterium]|nr:thiamine pyrophosphate-binding protein [Dehalococcoidales bacterium]
MSISPVDHPQYLGDLDLNSESTREILEKTDVLVVIGARFFQQALYFSQPLLPQSTRVIHIDDDPWQIAKNYPVDCNVEGDIKTALSDLAGAFENKATDYVKTAVDSRIRAISLEKQAMVRAFHDKILAERDHVPASGTRLMQEIRDTLKPDTYIVDDCWSYSSTLRMALPLNDACSYQRSRGGGSIGGGLPCALGAKLALPQRPVVCISGDGSAMWGIQSLWVGAHYNIPVTFIILSNGAYRQVRIMETKILGERYSGRTLGTELFPPRNDFCRIAEGMGLVASRVERPEQLKKILKQSFECNRPNLVEVTVDASF